MLSVFLRFWSGGSRRQLLGAATVVALLVAVAPAQAAPFAYVNNLGGNVSQYDIGAGGLLAPLSPPTVAAGRFPARLTVSPDGKSLYATNAGPFDDSAPDSVSQYDIGPNGRLSPKSPFKVAAGDSPRGVVVRPDGKSAYVANEVSDDVSQYDVGLGGNLSPKSAAAVAVDDAVALAVSPGGKSVYVVSSSSEIFGGDNAIYQFDVEPGGRLSPKSPRSVPAGDFPVDIAVNPEHKRVYVVDHGVFFGSRSTAGLLQFKVGPGGRLSPMTPAKVAAGTLPEAVAVSPNGESVYVTDDGSSTGGGRDNVFQYDAGSGGRLVPKSPPRVGTGKYPLGIAVSPSGQSVYVVNGGNSGVGSNVSQYSADHSGRLHPKSPLRVAAGQSPEYVALSPVPTTKHQCKHRGWKRFGFQSKRRCVCFVKHRSRR